MFKATLDGNGLVIYSTSPGGEVLADMSAGPDAIIDGVPVDNMLAMEPSTVLKGAYVIKNSYADLPGIEKPSDQLSSYAPFDMLRFGPASYGSQGNIFLKYLLERHPDVMLVSVEVEYREAAGTSTPVALTMMTMWPGAEWSHWVDPFVFIEPSGDTTWKTAVLDLFDGDVNESDTPCPFSALSRANYNESGLDYESGVLRNCFRHLGMWTDEAHEGVGAFFLPPVFYLCGGFSAVRRITFNFASSVFWTGYKNSVELIQLYERPEPDPEDPGGGEEDYDMLFEFTGAKAESYALGEYSGLYYPTVYFEHEEAGNMNVLDGLTLTGAAAITAVRGKAGGITEPYENYSWHMGSSGGLFLFHADGFWRFDAFQMFYELPPGETLETHVDVTVTDEAGGHTVRVSVPVEGELHDSDPYLLRYTALAMDSSEYDTDDSEKVIASGNVFSNANTPLGWTVTAVRGSAGYVGNFVSSVGGYFNGCSVKIEANGDYQVRLESSVVSATELVDGAVYDTGVSFDATNSGNNKSSSLKIYVRYIAPPSFEEGYETSHIETIGKTGSASGQIDLTKIVGGVPAVYSCDVWCDPSAGGDGGELCPAAYSNIGETGGTPYVYRFVEDDMWPGGNFILEADGSWSFDTAGDFDAFGSETGAGLVAVVKFTIDGEPTSLLQYEIIIQISGS